MIQPSEGSTVLWYGDSLWAGGRAGMDEFQVREFTESVEDLREWNGGRPLLLPGDAAHAGLIVELVDAGERVFVGSPAPLRAFKAPEADEPTVVDRLMSLLILFDLSPHYGGWRAVTASDYSVMRFLASYHHYGPTAETYQKMRQHPAYPAVTFPLHSDPTTQMRLLAMIEDPRWFSDVNKPDSISRLKTYMGLTFTNASRYFGNRCANNRYRYERAETALAAAIDAVQGNPRDPRDCFTAHYLSNVATRSSPVAGLRTATLFLSFLRQVWLHESVTPARELFVPEHFFEQINLASYHTPKALAKAYRDYRGDAATTARVPAT